MNDLNPSPHLGGFTLLKNVPAGHCPECAVEHHVALPHNQQSLFYQYKFRETHGRWPTWRDAMAHCTPEMQELWCKALAEKGVIVPPADHVGTNTSDSGESAQPTEEQPVRAGGQIDNKTMHYKNGRPAKNGDKVILISPYDKTPVAGILYDATAGNDYCNGRIALTSPSDPCPNLKECLHVDDVEGKPYVAPEAATEEQAAAPEDKPAA